MKKIMLAIIENWKVSLAVFASVTAVTAGGVAVGLSLSGADKEPVAVEQVAENVSPVIVDEVEESKETYIPESEVEEESQALVEESLEEEESAEQTTNAGKKPTNSSKPNTTATTTASKDKESSDSQPQGTTTNYTSQTSDPKVIEYLISMFDGSNKIQEVKKAENTLLTNVSAPYQDGKIFLGWYYDAALTQKVGKTDALTKDIILYANYGEAIPLNEGGSSNFASAIDVDKNYSITVDAHDTAMHAASVQAALKLSNLSSPSRTDSSDAIEKDVMVVTDLGGGKFSIKAKDGFQEGATYKLEIVSGGTASGLTFDGCTSDVVYYNFTVAKKEVMNLALDSNMKYLPASGLSAEDAKNVLAYSGLYRATQDASGNTVYESSNAFGTFQYTKDAYIVGDVVAVYKGNKPDGRDLTNKNAEGGNEVAYLEITAVNTQNGVTTYSYKSAKATDVLFTPDVLPIDIDAGDGVTGWSASGTSLTILSSKLDFSSGYEDIGLDHQTVVEPGDFMTFYAGVYGQDSMSNRGYAKITSVTNSGTTTQIQYALVSQDDIMSSMDLYSKSELTKAQLDSIDSQLVASTVTEQVLESGFAQEAGLYLAQLAVETDEVRELLGEQDLTFKDCIITYPDGTPVDSNDIALMGNVFSGGGEGMPEISVNVSKKLEHFEDGKGVRVELAVKYGFDIQKKGSKKKIAIEMTAIFEDEILLKLSTKGGAIWRNWGPIPYIYDYEMTGNIDQGIYTGIAITATAQLDEDETPFGPEMLKPEGLDDYGQKILDLGNSIQQMMEASKMLEPESEGSATGGLIEKYSDFVENANDKWIDLVDVPILSLSGAVDPFYVLAYSFDANFVVSANLNVAIGMSFQYEKSQRHTFTMRLFHQNEGKSDTVDLGEEYFQFDFYVMGTLGVRAGIRAKVLFGLFSTKLDGIGVQFEAGAYARLWGYFYYCLSWNRDTGKKSSATGAMYIEIGAYLEVNLCLEVLDGTFSYSPTLYSGEWPIWNVGERENVLDFAYEEFEPSSFDMVRDTQIVVPSEVFNMKYLDLKEGGEDEKNYDNTKRGSFMAVSSAYDDEERFFIEISKPFVYNPVTNTISLDPASGYYSYEGTLTITWKQPDLTYASKTISRTFDVTWTDPDKGTCLIFNTNGGSLIRTQVSNPGEATTEVADPTKVGYKFAGWYSEAELKNVTTVPTEMPAKDTTLYAKWEPIPNQYSVVFEYEGVNKVYSFSAPVIQKYYVDTNKRVYTDDVLNQEQIIKDNAVVPRGFEINYDATTKSAKIAPDGSTVVYIYYKRLIHSVTYTMGALKDSDNPDVVYKYRFEEGIYAPTLFMVGYTFKGWDKTLAKSMDIENLTYNAVWEPNANTPYYLEYYAKNPETDQYIMLGGSIGKVYKEGTTGATVSVRDNLLKEEGYTFQKASVNGVDTTVDGSGVIDAKGRLIIRYYYEVKEYKVNFDANGGVITGQQPTKYYRGTALSLENVIAQKTGYTFVGWVESEEASEVLKEISNTRSGDITLVAKWAKKKNTISLYDIDGTTSLGTVTATYEELVPGLTTIPTKSGYEFKGFYTSNGIQYYDQNGAGLVLWDQVTDIALKAKWTPGKVTIAFDPAGGATVADIEGTYLSKYPTLPTTTKVGYVFAGWTLDGVPVSTETTLSKVEKHTLVATWTAATDTAYTIEFYKPAATYSEENKVFERMDAYERRGTTGAAVNLLASEFSFIGYTFMNGYAENVLSGFIAADGTTVLKLYYKESGKYTVSFTYSTEDYSNEIPVSTSLVEGNTGITLPTYTQDTGRVTLIGWKANGAVYKAGTSYTVTNEDVSFTAVWERKTYEVTYRNLVGTERFMGQICAYGIADTVLPYMLGTPTRKNDTTGKWQYRAFQGWYTKESSETAGGTWYQPGDSFTDPGNGTLYAQWGEWTDIPEGAYYVSYKIENNSQWNFVYGTVIQLGTVGQQTAVAPVPLLDSTVKDFEQKTITALDENGITTTVEVEYNLNKHTYTLDFDGGYILEHDSSTNTDEKKYSKSIEYLFMGANAQIYTDGVVPVKEGYEFIGWSEYIPSYVGTKDITAVARYRRTDLYLVTIEYQTENPDGSGYTTADTQVVYQPVGSFTLTNVPVYTGFTAQSVSAITVEANNNNKYVVKYNRNSYTITWNPGEGALADSSAATATVKYGAAIPAGPAVVKTGYTGSWKNLPSTMPAQDMTFIASYTGNRVGYDILYRLEKLDGLYDSLKSNHFEAIAGSCVEASSSITDERITDAYVKPLDKAVTIAGDGSTVIYMDYKLIRSNVSYDFAGGTPTDSNYAKEGTYKYGKSLQIPLVTSVQKPGYTAVGWYDASDERQTIITTRSITVGATDVTYKMKWEPNTYTITYDLNMEGAKNVTNPVCYQPGADFNISGATVDGYAFKTWEWNGEGSMPAGVTIDGGVVHVSTTARGSLSFKAVWEPYYKQFVGLMYEGATDMYIANYPESTDPYIKDITVPTRDGYVFAYWTKKVPDAEAGFYTVKIGDNTRVSTLNVNTDFVTAHWMKITAISDGVYSIHVNTELEWNKAVELLKSDARYKGITVDSNFEIKQIKTTVFDTFETDYVLDGADHRITVNNMKDSLIGTNYGTVKHLAINGVINNTSSNAGAEASSFGAFAKENYGSLEYCSLSVNSSDLQYRISFRSDAAYVGGLVGKNYATVFTCSVRNASIAWKNDTFSESGTGYIGGIAGYNAQGGEIAYCEVKEASVVLYAGEGLITRNQTVYMGGVAGRNMGLIRNSNVKSSYVGSRVKEDGTVAGKVYAGGFAAMDDVYEEAVTEKDTRGIRNCSIDGLIVVSDYVAGGLMAECNYTELLNNTLKNVSVTGNQYAGQIAGIYDYNRDVEGYTNISEARVEAGASGNAGVIAGFARKWGSDKPSVSFFLQVRSLDNKTKVMNGTDSKSYNKGLFYGVMKTRMLDNYIDMQNLVVKW